MVLVNGIFLRSKPEDIQTSPWGQGKDVPPDSLQREGASEKGLYREIFRSSPFWTIGASYFSAACALYIVTTFMVDYANVELGFSFKKASFLATIHGLSQVIGVLTIPILSDRIGRRLTLMGSNFFIALSIVGIVVSGKSLFGLYWSVAVVGMLYGVTWPMYGACAGDYFRKEVMGTVIGVWTPFYGMGAVSAHVVAGRIRDITGSFQTAFYLAIIFALIASFLMQRVRKTHKDLYG